ncbi:hypothetical protein KA050_02285 [Candidatus Gracilibacteria bacterium]|nr:hypothetical protein [Candidatus Gracilibacteria bacterium]
MSEATPQALVQDAQALLERAGQNIFQESEVSQHDAIFAVFLIRQKVLVIIESFPAGNKSIDKLYDACSEEDIGYFSCMVYELAVAGDTRSILDILSRYRSIVSTLHEYLTSTSSKKISFRGLTSDSEEGIRAYEDVPEEKMKRDIIEFRMDIASINGQLKNWDTLGLPEKRKVVIEMMKIREALHQIFGRIHEDADTNDGDLQMMLGDFNTAFLESMSDLPMMVEEVEEHDNCSKLGCFIDFLSVAAQRLQEFFDKGDYDIFEGLSYYDDFGVPDGVEEE